jgi:hypothetical protein
MKKKKIQGKSKFWQSLFFGKKNYKNSKLSELWGLSEKFFGKKNKIYIRGVKMHI